MLFILKMLKYHGTIWNRIILLTAAYLVFFLHHTHATNELKKNSPDYYDQFMNQTSTSSENQAKPSHSWKTEKRGRASHTKYLSLFVSRSKINLIKQKEKELKSSYSNFSEFPRQSGHHWNLSELSDREALNLCYSLWLGLTFSDIEEIDKTDLPSQLYAYCKEFKKIPIGDIRNTGRGNFCYNIVYPYTEKQFLSKPHRISVLKCLCTFAWVPMGKATSNDSKRYFLAHKLIGNEYLILSPVSKDSYVQRDLKIIDVQEVDPTTVHHGNMRAIPISTTQTMGNTDEEMDTCTSDENQERASGYKGTVRIPNTFRADKPKYLSLSVSQSKIDLIIQKEYELKTNYDNLAEFSTPPGHVWNISELSETETVNVCYSVWLRLTFSEIDGIDKANLPPQLYPYCKYKKYSISDQNSPEKSGFRYNIVYPHTEKDLKTKHKIGVLQCSCRFTRLPNSIYISNDTNRKFCLHKLQFNDEYLILSPVSKQYRLHRNLGIIDVQEIDPVSLHFGDKRSIPISTN